MLRIKLWDERPNNTTLLGRSLQNIIPQLWILAKIG